MDCNEDKRGKQGRGVHSDTCKHSQSGCLQLKPDYVIPGPHCLSLSAARLLEISCVLVGEAGALGNVNL